MLSESIAVSSTGTVAQAGYTDRNRQNEPKDHAEQSGKRLTGQLSGTSGPKPF